MCKLKTLRDCIDATFEKKSKHAKVCQSMPSFICRKISNKNESLCRLVKKYLQKRFYTCRQDFF